jgi:hypothetical protein
MRAAVVVSIVVMCVSGSVLGAPLQSEQTRTKKAPKTITLAGCAQVDDKAPSQVMFTDTKSHVTYRLTGLDIREYLGRPIQIDGGFVAKGVKIAGGLLPNPNVAAQAGAIDPAHAAVAGASGIGPTGGPVDIQEFRVKAIRPGSGACEP